jgi:hypothetical protein
MQKARNTSVKIFMNGVDVTRDLSPHLKALTLTDNLSCEADALELELVDREKIFLNDWFPELSTTLSATLVKKNWTDGQSELELGEFEIDEVEASLPPSTFKIKAVSISQNSALRQRDESKSWENVRLSEIAAQIASESGVELFYQATDDPEIKRAEQGEQSRLAFLEKICADNYLILKVGDNKLIICDESELERQEPARELDRETTWIKHFTARKTLQDVYGSAEVSYKEPKQSELFTAKYGSAEGKAMKINRRVTNQGAAEKLARNELRRKNKKETEVNITTVGDFDLMAGNTVALKNFGHFDGNYLIEKATHTVGNGYETKIELRLCLEY